MRSTTPEGYNEDDDPEAHIKNGHLFMQGASQKVEHFAHHLVGTVAGAMDNPGLNLLELLTIVTRFVSLSTMMVEKSMGEDFPDVYREKLLDNIKLNFDYHEAVKNGKGEEFVKRARLRLLDLDTPDNPELS